MHHGSGLFPLIVVVALLPLLYFRMRKMLKPQPLKLGRMWIRPAILVAVAGSFLFLRERTAESGRDTESQKQICLDTGTRYHATAVAIHLAEQPEDLVTRSERFKCVVSLSPIQKIGI